MLLAMVHHPEVMKKAQMQLDEVVGQKRLPTFDDQDRLPYIGCILRETLRWGTPVPLCKSSTNYTNTKVMSHTM